MQDSIPISLDDRSFTFWEWLGFLLLFTFITVHCVGLCTGTMLVIWEDILSGDYTGTDVFWAVVWTTIAGPALLFFYVLFWGLLNDPFFRSAILLDTRDNQLLMKTRHITGRTGQQVLPLSDIRGVTVAWTKSEDGPNKPETRILTKGEPVTVTVTNPADADAVAFAERFKAHLAAIGWKDDQA
jgi:hypothetical protein